ncbi:SDR family oxidoreductase [Streptomyces mangrovisoli]|uniref:Short chain dehydrogenase n=1 Tax=Streptomyces mangrovisoli TaxID=1428628 RepID=A0A1J4P216_9ACTN|nr:NAD(P)-dependent oxidoreductase [Streptomyces mangrovisoli]OIJ68258.1 short chain dehydrogenase [Streptomyces mangrovisoli]
MTPSASGRLPLTGRTLLMSGGSRGIGLAIALRAARDGANVALLAKTDTPRPRLAGTVHTAAAEIEKAGGKALPIVGDVRDEDDVRQAVEATVEQFGGIDVVVNNASAITLQNPGELPLKRYDLMMDVNVRGTFLLSSLALPHLRASGHAHVLTLSPPLNPDRRWLRDHAPYTVSKYGMTMLTLGIAEEHRGESLSANCLWPATTIATAATASLRGADEAARVSRTPQIMADAAHAVLTRPAGDTTGHCLIDEDVLRGEGVTDFGAYRADPDSDAALRTDIFL